MSEAALGIDIGTSGLRAVLLGRGGDILAMRETAMVLPLQSFGRLWQDPHVWAAALDEVLLALRSEFKAHQVLALAIDGTSGTIVPTDIEGTPAGLASMYNDVAAQKYLDPVMKVAPQETAARGGSSPLARALEMQATIKPVRILHQADWLSGRFSGRFDVSDENNALKTGYDPVARRWPGWIVETGLAMELLPQVVAAGERTAKIRPAIADRYSLPRNVAIVAGTTDGCAALLASGASEPGDGVTSLGTTLTLKLLSDRPVFAPDYGIYSHRIGDQWLAGGASNTGGAALNAYVSRTDIVRLTPLIDPDQPTGLDYYPLPKPGERFPINDPNMESRVTPKPDDERLFFQGLLEGIAGVEALAYRRLAELGATPLKSLRTVGGGAANEGWTRIRERLLGVANETPRSEHAAVGAARLAWRGMGHDPY
ncbi:FGGY-family carbohydrate kinase [Nordella sp. HKS 07]|uniref:FGGY-family carbohydrate kinase n=1 Tax=Nordella sp. HKS 07 TaxID=2712222 RepID=UPI0013E175ED|nr:FGGY-family carbohydrate kinase [Nordella sp. HKS 07]QIG47905.1 FGGY-family carbohydrate kinase [Nordella sp. HKS 07]